MMTTQTYSPAENTPTAPVTLTPAAVDHIHKQLSAHPEAPGLRLGVRTSGCSGWAYDISLADQINEDDIRIDIGDGRAVFIAPDAVPYIKGTEIDFISEGLNRMFRFNNPNVDAECGCGESFSVKA